MQLHNLSYSLYNFNIASNTDNQSFRVVITLTVQLDCFLDLCNLKVVLNAPSCDLFLMSSLYVHEVPSHEL